MFRFARIQEQTAREPSGGAITRIYAAFAICNLLLSARFLTSSSQSFASANQIKPVFAVALVAGLIIGFRLLTNPVIARRYLSGPTLAALMLVAFAVINYVLYPILDRSELKLVGEGSDADDALIDAASRWLRGEAPYAAPTYRGNPISPGIGWVLLNAPLATQHLFFLLTPIYLTILGLILRLATGRWQATNVVILAHLSCVGFWEMAPTQDLAAAGLALCAAFVMAYIVRGRPVALIVVSILMGVLATARVPFIAFPALVAILLWPSSGGRSAIVGILGTAVAGGTHLIMLLLGSPYPPLHLLEKGWDLLGPMGIAATGAVTAAMAAWAVAQQPAPLPVLLGRCAACLAGPLGLVAAAQLVSIEFSVGRWEGANYLMPVFSFVAAALAVRVDTATQSAASR